MDDVGRRLLGLLAERGCVELLAILELDEPERADWGNAGGSHPT